MSVSKYPTATRYLKEIRTLRDKLETLTQWIDPLSGQEEERSVRSFDPRTRRRNSGEAGREIARVRRQLDQMTEIIRRAVRRLSSPGEALLIELIYVHGLDAATICAGLSLSRSGFYRCLSSSMLSLEAQLKRIEISEGCAAPFRDGLQGGAPVPPDEEA